MGTSKKRRTSSRAPRTTIEDLTKAATKARDNAYAPYSKFRVGAAVLTQDGRIFEGANIENASFGATMCAERVAIFTAIAAGHRRFKAIAVVADQDRPVTPCGLCRQVFTEFAPNARVIMANTKGTHSSATVRGLLPRSFKLPSK